MTRLLYVSPHLDDVVFSCAGRLHRDVSAGDQVTVVTVCTADQAERSREDVTALTSLGCLWIHLGLPDGADRPETTLFGSPGRFVEAAAQALGPVVRAADRVIGPLGVGGHVDHMATFEALERLGGVSCWYVDLPYAQVPGAVEARVRSTGTLMIELPSCVSDPLIRARTMAYYASQSFFWPAVAQEERFFARQPHDAIGH